MTRKRPSLVKYLTLRLGSGSPKTWLWAMCMQAFTATTFRRFWHYWNPLYGYYLANFCYVPLRRVATKRVSFVTTFAVSGFLLHDLPVAILLGTGKLPFPFVTVAFIGIAVIILISEFFGVKLDRVSRHWRVASHIAVILGAFTVSAMVAALYRHAG